MSEYSEIKRLVAELIGGDNLEIRDERYLMSPAFGVQLEALVADADRYRKLQRYMASNVKEGWQEVEMLGGICAWMSMEDMDHHLDCLPICNVGLCEINSSPENS